MIDKRRTKQDWGIGKVVRVGFLQLRVLKIDAIVDGLPDIYTMESLNHERQYEFVPHNGLTRIR